MKTKNTLFALALSVIFGFVPTLSFAYTINDTGGDCAQFGAWDGTTKTCTLTTDVSGSISVTSNNTTIDGAGKTLTGGSGFYEGIRVNYAENVTVKNLTIQGFTAGIFLLGNQSSYVSISNNTILGPGTYGIYSTDMDSGRFIGNTIKNFKQGMNFTYCSMGHEFTGNTIEGNETGAYFAGSTGTFSRNNFIGNGLNIQNASTGCGRGNEDLYKPLPVGGNYWSSNTECVDADHDNMCDVPFLAATTTDAWGIPGVDLYDNFPWTQPNGWNSPTTTSIILASSTETEDDGINDGKGVADKTKFTFSVTATGDPDSVSLFVDGSSIVSAKIGDTYAAISTFPKGVHSYYFEVKKGTYATTTAVKTFTTGYSNVAFLPGIEATRLYKPNYNGGTERLWEPEYFGNHYFLSLDGNGSSTRSDIYAKDIIETAYALSKGNIYSSFISSMNDLKNNGTIADWEPLPYDWRLSFDEILNNGAEFLGGRIYYTGDLAATGTPYIIQEICRLAESSDTGKVTIIGHSMGGLIAKNLTVELGAEESSKLIDQMIFIDSPQTGTPQSIGVLLHGFDQGLPSSWFPAALTAEETRDLSQNMPSIYNLLPSSKYFSYTDDPVITFDESPLLALWKIKYGAQIHSSFYLSKFLADSLRETLLTKETLNNPTIVNSLLLGKAETLHDAVLDSWTPPTNVNVSEIVGWGVMTAKTIEYKQGTFGVCTERRSDSTCAKIEQKPALEYDVVETLDGDGTVVAPSALYTTGAERWWVNLGRYDDELPQSLFHYDRKHADILEVPTLRTLIQNILTRTEDSTSLDFISRNKPTNTDDQKTRLHFTLRSPLSLSLCDNLGNCTNQSEQNIPASDYREYGALKIIDVPNSSSLHLELKGITPGSFTLNIQEFLDDTEIASTTFAGIPSLTETTASLDIPANGGVASSSPLLVDENGDGTIDIFLTPKLGETVFPDFTPPEAKISVDPTTKDLLIEGIDENPTTVSKNGNNYTITDSSGNTTVLFFQKTFALKRLTYAKLTGVQYGNDSKISLPSSSFIYLWNPALISQTVAVKKDVLIEAIYNKKQDQTTVLVKKKGVQTQKQIFTGLRILKLVINKGVIGYEI